MLDPKAPEPLLRRGNALDRDRDREGDVSFFEASPGPPNDLVDLAPIAEDDPRADAGFALEPVSAGALHRLQIAKLFVKVITEAGKAPTTIAIAPRFMPRTVRPSPPARHASASQRSLCRASHRGGSLVTRLVARTNGQCIAQSIRVLDAVTAQATRVERMVEGSFEHR